MIENTQRILVTGADGQLGQCINNISYKYPDFDFDFTNSIQLDITNEELVVNFFQNNFFDYVINCAAYTNVEQVEKESDKAFMVNAVGVKNLADACQLYGITLIHISTDYVFDGLKKVPYSEEDTPKPINEYGKSKLQGEQSIQKTLDQYFIIRTSWLYSQFGKNFYRTILNKIETEKKLTITTSEIGTPTNANDLAIFILSIVLLKSEKYGIYHFSNQGESTWYDFAEEILKISGKQEVIKIDKTDNYATFAKRPTYSVLDKKKSIESFNFEILNWKISLNGLYHITE